MHDKCWALLKWASLGISIGSVALAAGMMWMSPSAPLQDKAVDVASVEEQPQTMVEKPVIVERKGERIIWRLQANAASQQNQGMHLTEPRLELFTDDGEVVPIQAREAWFQPIRKNIRFKGKVTIRFREWKLESETLRYSSGQDAVLIPGAFVATRPGTSVHGKGLTADRKSQRVTVARNVRVYEEHMGAFGGQ